MSSAQSKTQVAVLMATRNGARFVSRQMESLHIPDSAEVSLLVSDDGSTDDTLPIIRQHPRVPSLKSLSVTDGPQQGFCENFRHLILTAPQSHDVYMFCDQDDVWAPEKIAHSVDVLKQLGAPSPALYCGRTRIIDEQDQPEGLSPLFSRPPSFRNALVQSIAGGNTMAFNRAAFAILRQSLLHVSVVSHDWWAYQIIAGSGGQVIYDPNPLVGYRRHASNLVGPNTGFLQRLSRFRRALGGQFSDWNAINFAALEHNRMLLKPECRDVFDKARHIRSASMAMRVRAFLTSGIHRQSAFDTVRLLAACIAGKA